MPGFPGICFLSGYGIMYRMRHFCTEKFKSYLLPGTFSAFIGYVGRLSDSVIVGHVIGEDALAGINMVTPILSVVTFLAYMIAMGTATNYSIWMGRIDRTRARQFFMQGLWLTLIVGCALALFMVLGKDFYFSMLSGSEYVEMYGRQYLNWAWPVGLTEGLLLLLAVFCCADGDIRFCSLVYGGVFILNIVISYAAVRLGMGASGCALGTVIAETLGILCLCGHFFRSVNTFAPVRHFSLLDSWYVFRASFGDAAAFLCDAVLFFLLCKLVIVRFDSDMLPVAGVAIVVWSFLEIFNGIGVAVQPLVTVYWGERNTRAIRKVMQAAMYAALAEGLFLGILFFLFPDAVIRMVGVEGIDYPELLDAARGCVRLVSVGFVPLAFAGLFNSYFLFIERPWISLYTTIAGYLAFPAVCVVVGSCFGLDGTWLGLGLGPLLGVLAMAVAILVKRGRHGFPMLLPRKAEAKTMMFDLVLSEKEIVRVSNAVREALPDDVAVRAALMVEEVFMTVRERNPGRKRLLGEVTLDLNDGIVMTLRDDGVIFDITDADAKVSSLRTYLVATVMERQRERINLVTSGFNRNVFRFK